MRASCHGKACTKLFLSQGRATHSENHACSASGKRLAVDIQSSVNLIHNPAHLGISRVMLSRVLHCHAAVSADMDLRLSEALGTSPSYWLAMQTQRDLWLAKQTAKENS